MKKFPNALTQHVCPTAAVVIGLLVCGVANAQISYTTSWLGNSFPGGRDGDAGGQWVQNYTENIYVLPDGRVITNSGWDEAGADAVVYQNGQIVNGFAGMHCCGGQAVTANANSVFLSYSQGRQAGTHGVKRYSYSGSAAGSVVINSSRFISGLAASASEVFVSDPASNSIIVLDANSLGRIRQFGFSNPGRIVLDRSGTLWIVDTGSNRIRHFSTTGGFLGQEIADAGKPTALAIDSQGRLMVGDSGTRQQILFYNISGNPFLAGTFGVSGGIYSGTPGQVSDLKLISPTGVGTDSAGNIYVSSSLAGSDLRAFSSGGQKLWSLQGLEFVDVAVADPATDGADVYTKHEHFKMDFSKGPGKEATWAGMTIDSLKYPTDPRLTFDSIAAAMSVLAVRNVQGRKYLYVTDQYSNFLAIYRMNAEIAVPAGFIIAKAIYQSWLGGIIPSGQSSMWRDSNGNGNIDAGEISNVRTPDMGIWGWDVDNQGNIYAASEGGGIAKYSLQSIDAAGVPAYSAVAYTPAPAPFTRLGRIRYIQATDTMYLAGFTTDRPYQNVQQDFGLAGSEIIRYDNWSTGNRTPRVRIPVPYDPANTKYVKAFDVAGQRVFAGLLRSSKTDNVYVYDADTGKSLGTVLPGAEINYNIGWIDGAENLKAFQRSNGEYLLFEEEVVWAKVLMFRIGGTPPSGTPPTVSLTAPTASTVSGTVTVSASASDTVGIAGVQFLLDGANLGPEITSAPYTLSWNTTTVSNGSHTLSAVARNTAGLRTTSAPKTVTVSNLSGSFSTIRVNAGGAAFTDAAGRVWNADYGFSGGAPYQTTNAIANTSDQPLYQTERWNPDRLTYQFAVPNGDYTINLKFAEIYNTQAGQRVFDVVVNNQTMLSRFDIIAKAGAAMRAIDQQLAVRVAGGLVTIQLVPVVSNPKISAIEIVQTATVGVALNTSAVTVSAGKTYQFTATVTGSSNTAVTWQLTGPGTLSSSGLYTAPATVSSNQTAAVKAVSAADSTKSASATVTITPAAFKPIRVNAGGNAYQDSAGNIWSADTGFSGGSAYQTTNAISGTTAAPIYQSERWSDTPFQYQFTVPDGTYTVRLKFAEIFFPQPGQRVFNVVINGQTVLTNFDIVAQAGGVNRAVDKQFPVAVSGGKVTIQLVPVVQNPKISAIEIF